MSGVEDLDHVLCEGLLNDSCYYRILTTDVRFLSYFIAT
jgi:hypothetical protein